MTRIPLPNIPYRGTRSVDAWGAGGFGAPRFHKGKEAKHKGVDLVTIPDDAIIAVAPGRIHIGLMYAHSMTLKYVNIITDPYTFHVGYVLPFENIKEDMHVEQGDPIGHAQNISGYWWDRIQNIDEEWTRRLKRSGARMTNHVHFGVRHVDGTWLNPGAFLTDRPESV